MADAGALGLRPRARRCHFRNGSNCDLPAQMCHVRSDPETGSDLAASKAATLTGAADRDRGGRDGGRAERRSTGHAAGFARPNERGRQTEAASRIVRYVGGCRPGDDSHRLIWEAVCS
jgi:hypothetical protein